MPCDARDNADGSGDEDEEDEEDGEGVQAYSLARRIRPRSPSATRFWDNGRGGA